jgi:hypothetical protein
MKERSHKRWRKDAKRRVVRWDDSWTRRRPGVTQTRMQRLPGTLPYSLTGARRGRLFGHNDRNAELVLYGEAWARKIQLNTTSDMFPGSRTATAH